MAYATSAIVLLCVCSYAFATPPSQQDYGLCSQVYLMNQYCTSQMDPTSTGVTPRTAAHPRVGKSGPRGIRGPPGVVNYTAIEEETAARYADMEAKFDAKFERLERKVNAQLEKGNAEIDKFRNESASHAERIEEHREGLEATIDDKFERLERKVNAELQKGNAEIEKLRNDTMKNSERIEENWQRTFGLASCSYATQSNVRSWDGKGGIVHVLRERKFYDVYCDVTTDGGGWTMMQRRKDGSVDFYRTWEEYADGFGNKLGEFWLGLENIYQLTQDGAYELRVDLADWDGSTAYAKYGTFSISGRSDNYRLIVGQYSGTAGDSMTYSTGRLFSAKNKDLDVSSDNCASRHGGAWWYDYCAHSSLNGRYNDTSATESGVYWYHWRNKWHYSLKGSEMKFRKK